MMNGAERFIMKHLPAALACSATFMMVSGDTVKKNPEM